MEPCHILGVAVAVRGPTRRAQVDPTAGGGRHQGPSRRRSPRRFDGSCVRRRGYDLGTRQDSPTNSPGDRHSPVLRTVGTAVVVSAREQVKGRGLGWNYASVSVDDHSGLADAEVLPDEEGATCAPFLHRVLVRFRSHGVVVRRVLTNNAKAERIHRAQPPLARPQQACGPRTGNDLSEDGP